MGKDGANSGIESVGSGKAPVDISIVGNALAESRKSVTEEETDEPEIDLHEDRAAELISITAKFTEKKIRNMIRAPFELAFLKTGCEGVRIKDAEIDLILEDTVDILNALVKINPLWLAVGSVVVNGGMITMSKIDAYGEFQKAKKAAAKSAEAKQS